MSASSLIRLLVLALFVVGMTVVAALAFGSERLGASAFLGNGIDHSIVMRIRLPRVLLALLVGAILAGAGSTFQTLLRNPLADPFILGVSGGAASAAATAAMAGWSQQRGLMFGAAFFGAGAATLGVFFLARRAASVDVAKLLISGLVLNAFFSSIILLVLGYARGGDLSAALRWMTGSLAGAEWRDVWIVGVALIVMTAVITTLSSDLRMLAFGEEDARARGVAVERTKLVGYFVASLATGAAVAVSGIIGFVGLLVPHLVRARWGSDFRVNFPLSVAFGGALLVAADATARSVAAPAELPVGALLALLGVPFFVWILRRA